LLDPLRLRVKAKELLNIDILGEISTYKALSYKRTLFLKYFRATKIAYQIYLK